MARINGRTALAHLASPRTVVVIGRSHRTAGIIRNLERVDGLTVYSCSVEGDRVGLMTQTPDVAIVYANAEQCSTAVRTAASAGARSVIIEAAGFGESSARGRVLERELLATAREVGVRLLGPNSLGVYNGRRNLTTAPFPMPDLTGGSASLVVQSGVMAGGLLADVMKQGHFRLNTMVSLGGRVDLDEVDCLNYFERDPNTTAVGCYFEQVGASARFARSVQRLAAAKPVVAMLGGRTAAGSAAASRHTGRRGASVEQVRAILDEAGIPVVERLRDLLEVTGAVAEAAPGGRLPREPRVAVVTLTGSGAVAMVDTLEDRSCSLATLSRSTVIRMEKVLPDWLPVENPIDLWPSLVNGHGVASFREALSATAEDENVDAVVAIVPVWGETRGLDDFRTAVLEAQPTKPLILWAPGTEGLPERFPGVVAVPSLESVAPVLRALATGS